MEIIDLEGSTRVPLDRVKPTHIDHKSLCM